MNAFPGVCAVSHRQPALELLESLAGALQERGLRWYVFGAQAVILWGAPRTSADVDVTVEVQPEEVSDLVVDMERAGFKLRIRDVEGFLAQTRVLPFLHLPTEFPLDVVLAGPGLEELFMDRIRWVEMAGTTIPVISPEDLIVTKILAGRPKDLDDVRGILKERGANLDVTQVRETLDLLEQALGQSDLQPLFEAELARIK